MFILPDKKCYFLFYTDDENNITEGKLFYFGEATKINVVRYIDQIKMYCFTTDGSWFKDLFLYTAKDNVLSEDSK